MFKLRSIAGGASAAALALAAGPLTAQAAPADAVVAYASPPPHIRAAVAQVGAHICRRPWDAAATEPQTLEALKARAGRLGVNGLINVRFDRPRTDLRSIRWKRPSVRGEDVIVRD